MNLSEIENKINEILSDESRQIVMWYDGEQEFEEEINNLNIQNGKIWLLTDSNWLRTKYHIEREEPNTNFLVYAPFEKPPDEDNYLADMVHYSTLFNADKIALICQYLNIPITFRNTVEKFSKFWNSNQRTNDFKELKIHDYTDEKIIIGILCVLSKTRTLNFDYVLHDVIIKNLDDENKTIEEFKKFNIESEFWSLIEQKYDYVDANPTVIKLIINLILNYTSSLFKDGKTPKVWDEYLVSNKNNARVFIDQFMNNTKYIDFYDKIAAKIQEDIHIEGTLSNMLIENYSKCDSFEIFDENITNHYIDLLFENKNKITKLDKILRGRSKTHFYRNYENKYNVIKWANEFINAFNKFNNIVISDDIGDLIHYFTEDWVLIDKSYRKFYYYYDKYYQDKNTSKNIENLRQLIENMYKNDFLLKLTPKFTGAISKLDSLNDIHISKQWNFYRDNIEREKYKICVIISDAFRYGSGIELYDELNKDPTIKTSIKPMLSTIPSYTPLGMASLLPHAEIRYNGSKILVDGQPCSSSSDREKILKKHKPNALAVQYDDIKSLKIQELRDTYKNKDLIYIYHNQIDARGDNPATEDEVFTATEEAIGEIKDLITRLTNSNLFSNFYITADHGFIYKRDKIEESSKVDLSTINTFYKNKRFLLSNNQINIEASISLSLNYINNNDVYVTTPLGSGIFKTGGAGQNYVHGGASLEECIIPLLKVKTSTKSSSKMQSTVDLQLLSSNNRITNNVCIFTFYQSENVSKTVLPLEASVYFEDEDGEKISNDVIIYADKQSDSAEDREFKEKFTLKQKEYSKDKRYYMVIKDMKTNMEIRKEEFIVDIAFQDGFSF